MAMLIIGARIGGIHLIRAAIAVIRQQHINAAGRGVWFYIFWPVHRRGAQKAGGLAGMDQHIRLGVEAIGRRQRPLALHQIKPFDLAIIMEFGDRKHAFIQQIPIGGAIIGIPGAGGDEAIDEIKPLIIAHIDHHAAISIDGVMAAFMLEAAKGGALHRHRIRIIGIEFDNPAEAEGLIRFFFNIETINMIGPGIGSLAADAVAAEAFRMRRFRNITAEIEVEIFFRRCHRAPGRIATGAIVQRAKHQSPSRIGLGLQQIMAGSGAGNLHWGRGSNAAIEAAFLGIAPTTIVLANFHHGKPVRHDFGFRLFGTHALAGRTPCPKASPHHAGVGVFMIDHEQPVITARCPLWEREEIEVIIIVAELRGLRRRRGLARFEGRRTRQHRVAPADDGLYLITFGHGVTLRQGARGFTEGKAGRAA